MQCLNIIGGTWSCEEDEEDGIEESDGEGDDELMNDS